MKKYRSTKEETKQQTALYTEVANELYEVLRLRKTKTQQRAIQILCERLAKEARKE